MPRPRSQWGRAEAELDPGGAEEDARRLGRVLPPAAGTSSATSSRTKRASAACPQCGGEVRHRCPACARRSPPRSRSSARSAARRSGRASSSARRSASRAASQYPRRSSRSGPGRAPAWTSRARLVAEELGSHALEGPGRTSRAPTGTAAGPSGARIARAAPSSRAAASSESLPGASARASATSADARIVLEVHASEAPKALLDQRAASSSPPAARAQRRRRCRTRDAGSPRGRRPAADLETSRARASRLRRDFRARTRCRRGCERPERCFALAARALRASSRLSSVEAARPRSALTRAEVSEPERGERMERGELVAGGPLPARRLSNASLDHELVVSARPGRAWRTR